MPIFITVNMSTCKNETRIFFYDIACPLINNHYNKLIRTNKVDMTFLCIHVNLADTSKLLDK